MTRFARPLLAGIIGLSAWAGTADAATPFDGLYAGSASLSGGGRCDALITFKIRVTDGRFVWRAGSESSTLTVGNDGSFSGQTGRRFISGRIANGQLTATTRGEYCTYNWTLSK